MPEILKEDLDTTDVDNETDDNVDNLSKWKNPPSILDLKKDYQSARVIQQSQVIKINRWLDNLNVTGSAKRVKEPGKSSIVPKVIRKQAEWRYSSLAEPFLSTDDLFNVDPVTYEDKDSSVQNGLVLNNQFNTKLQKVHLVDESVRTIVDEGTVFWKVGWEYEESIEQQEVIVYEYVPSADPKIAQLHEELHQRMQSEPNLLNTIPEELKEAHILTMESGQPIVPVETGTEMVNVVNIVKNHPSVEVCDYNNLVMDPTAKGNLDKAGFVIYSFETSMSQLKEANKYFNLDKVNVSNSSILGEPDHDSNQENENFNFSDKPRKRLVAFEYWGNWDIDGSGITKPIVCTWIGDTIIQLEENPFPDRKHPFVSSQYLPVRKSVYGEPDGELLEDNQKIIGAVTRGMIDIMARSANGQMGSRKDALDITNRLKFEQGKDYQYNGNVDPSQAFYMHKYPEIPRSAEFMLNQQNAEAESLSGVKAFYNGITGNALGDSVGGQRNVLDATAIREAGILRRLGEGFKQIGRKIISMNSEFLSEEEVVRVTNEEFVTVKRDDLAGNFDLRLSISTAEADNAKAQELAFMIQTTAQTMGPEFAKIIMAENARLRKMPDLAKKIEQYQPAPDPLAVREAELRVALLEAQVENERAKAMENATDIGLKQAKTATEQAKTRTMHSQSDKMDLDYLEQQSSVKHDREIDKIETKSKTELDRLAANSILNVNNSGNQ